MASLFEELRPSRFDDVVGQDKAIQAIDRLRARGFGGRSIWIAGHRGTGKTTLARLIATEHSGAEWAIIEIDGTGLTAGEIERIALQTRTRPMFGGGWTVIINEAHKLTAGAIGKLLMVLDPPAPLACWIFTTTGEGDEELRKKQPDARPMIARCNPIPMSQRGLCEAFAALARETAQRLSMDGKPLQAYIRLVKDCNNDLRAVFSAIESGAMMAD